MSEQFTALSEKHISFIQQQAIFFVGTAADGGLVNVSPKGMDSFRVISPTKIIWLNLTGSGNETAAHLLENARMTVMFCSFDKQPLILRLYGSAKAIHPRDAKWDEARSYFPEHVGTRQFFELDLSLVQTSCGYAVPLFDTKKERPTLQKWAKNKGQRGIEDYWKENNLRSLNDKETNIF